MPDSLAGLEQQRSGILSQILKLGDFRSGSITAIQGQCGKPNCHCHRPNHPGHGPNFRLTRKINGKAVSERLFFRRGTTQGATRSGGLSSVSANQPGVTGSERRDLSGASRRGHALSTGKKRRKRSTKQPSGK